MSPACGCRDHLVFDLRMFLNVHSGAHHHGRSKLFSWYSCQSHRINLVSPAGLMSDSINPAGLINDLVLPAELISDVVNAELTTPTWVDLTRWPLALQGCSWNAEGSFVCWLRGRTICLFSVERARERQGKDQERKREKQRQRFISNTPSSRYLIC